MTADLAAAIIPHYERHAHAWDADRRSSSWNDRLWHHRFVAALPRDAHVLDLGCGSGVPVALHMAAHGLQVTGVDTSPTLLALWRGRLPAHRGILGDMRAPPLDSRFHGLLAWDSLFHLKAEDQRGMFRVFADHATDDAVLMFNAGPARGEAIGSYRGDPLYHASLDPADYARCLDGAGFAIVDHVTEDLTAGGRTVWLARRRSEAVGR